MTVIGVPAQQGTAHPDSLGSCSLQSPGPHGVAQGRADHIGLFAFCFSFFFSCFWVFVHLREYTCGSQGTMPVLLPTWLYF